MKITKKEVKTIYNIELTMTDFTKAFEKYHKSPLKTSPMFKYAFAEIDPNAEGSFTKLRDMFEEKYPAALPAITRSQTLNFIVEQSLGFDSIENYGFYVPEIDTYRLQVSMYGDRLNDGRE